MSFRTTVLAALVTTLLSGAYAQLRVGVVLSQTGEARLTGQAQANALGALGRNLRQRSGAMLELIIVDDASDPATAAREVERLVEAEGVHALICCTTGAATAASSAYVEAAGVLTLSPSGVADHTGRWLFSVVPDEERLLQSVILQQVARGQRRFALMTLDNRFGDAVTAALTRLISPEANTQIVAEARYAPNVTVLTPEALWTATRLPESVLVWGLARDTVLAYGALGARGYEGDVVLNPSPLKSGRYDLSQLNGAIMPVSPVEVASSLSQNHICAAASADFFTTMAQLYGPEHVPTVAAPTYDALELLRAAFDQAFTYGVPLDDLESFRGALRDAFIGMGPQARATAVFDYSESDPVGTLASSLVLARVIDGALVYEP